ncbi:MAG: hypothetical protein EXQ56_10715 [Acidobacteria bacterium]|nr:hypothetical protein [Acidobacteriota bacterium]
MCSGLYLCIGIFKYLPHEILSHFGWYRNRRAGQRNVPAAAVLNGKLYVIGGVVESAFSTATLEIYDPVTDSWSSGPPMPTARHSVGAGTLDGKLYAVGGFNLTRDIPYGLLEVYDPDTNSWTTKASTGGGQVFAVTVLGGKLFALYNGSVEDARGFFFCTMPEPTLGISWPECRRLAAVLLLPHWVERFMCLAGFAMTPMQMNLCR